jgi:hypothetical protein
MTLTNAYRESAVSVDRPCLAVSPQDKAYWIRDGEKKEGSFVSLVLPALGFRGEINPAKAADPYAPDLLVEGHLADLKCQRTPFFKARELHGVDPQYAVTFNRKDVERYSAQYPSIDIYFWIHWQETMRVIGGKTLSVNPIAGVWRASFATIRHLVELRSVRSHDYLHRLFDDAGNARSSYVFDVRRFEYLGGSAAAADVASWSSP